MGRQGPERVINPDRGGQFRARSEELRNDMFLVPGLSQNSPSSVVGIPPSSVGIHPPPHQPSHTKRSASETILPSSGLLKKPLSREQPPCPPLSGGLFFHPLVGGHRLYPPDKGGQGGCFYQSKGVSPLLSKKGSFSTTPLRSELTLKGGVDSRITPHTPAQK